MSKTVKSKLILSAEDRTERALRSAQSRIRGIEKAALLAGAALGGLGVAKLFSDMVRTTAEFQNLNASLVTVTGSQEKANKVFKNLQEFAASTPFQLQEVVTAYNKLSARGVDASNEMLTALGNTASGMGKTLDDMVEATADAVVGEFERLKEFGIKASSQGDEVAFTFKGVTTTVKKTSEDITTYLQNIGNVEFAGGMLRQMDTIGGAFSNLQDAYSKLLYEMGQGASGDVLIDTMADLTSAISDPAFVEAMRNFATGAAMLAKYGVDTAKKVSADIGVSAKWAAAYSVGQITWWEYMFTGKEGAKKRLAELEGQMSGGPIEPPGSPPAGAAAGSSGGSSAVAVTAAAAAPDYSSIPDPSGDGTMSPFTYNDLGLIQEYYGTVEEMYLEHDAWQREQWVLHQEAKQEHEDEMIRIEEEGLQYVANMRQGNHDMAMGLFQSMVSGFTKNALAGLLVSKGLAMADVFISTQSAAAAALAPPPLGLGPVAGAPLAAAIEAQGKIRMGLIAATGLMEAVSKGSGSGGSGSAGGSSRDFADQPRSLRNDRRGDITLVVQGNILGEDEYVQKRLIPLIDEAFEDRNVKVSYTG